MVAVVLVDGLIALHRLDDKGLIGGLLLRQGALNELLGAVAEVIAVFIKRMRRESVGLEHLVDADGQVLERVDERAVEVKDGCSVLHDDSSFLFIKSLPGREGFCTSSILF